ncbi:ABC transporter substrate-binding protein [Faunimonas sp. B44]|uniref:ABC transporter substrate-binding protein n=1 Tax=Faunimonas sp. B44 TaxID=3461493 RepID=UPI004044E7A6
MHSYLSHLRWSVVLAAAVLSLPATADPITIRAGIAVNFEGMLPVFAAEQKGYLKDANIELEKLDFQGGGPTVQAFVGDSIDICFCGGDHVVRLRSRNIPTVFLYGLDRRHNYALIGKEDLAGPGGLEGLQGKGLGITSPGSMTDNTLRWAIKEINLNPDADFQLLGSGTGASMIASIESGKVNAGMLVPIDAEFLKSKGGYKVVEDFTDLPYAAFAALVKESWVSAHPEEAKGFIEALNKAVADLKSDPQLGFDIIRGMYPSLSDDLIKYAVDSAVGRVPENGEFGQAEIDTLNAIMQSADSSIRPITVEESRPKL